MTFHPVLSPSPFEKAFCFVTSQHHNESFGVFSAGRGAYIDDAGDDSDIDGEPTFWLSPQEWSLLQSAEEKPLEYTLAENDDAVSYLRILFKTLDQVTSHMGVRDSSSEVLNGRVVPPHCHKEKESMMELDSPPLRTEDEAFDAYYRSTKAIKNRIVSQYCVDRIYEIIGVSLDNETSQKQHLQSSPRKRNNYGRIPSIGELFLGMNDDNQDGDEAMLMMRLEDEDWRPLLNILYNRSVDEYTKRGCALILAYILRAGYQQRETTATQSKPSNEEKTADEDLLDLFPEEHNTVEGCFNMETVNFRDKSRIDEILQSLISWLTSRLQSSNNYASLGVVMPTLSVLMSTTRQARVAFDQSGGVAYLVRHLKAKRILWKHSTTQTITTHMPSSPRKHDVQHHQRRSSPQYPPSPTSIRQRSRRKNSQTNINHSYSDTVSLGSAHSFSSTTSGSNNNNPFGEVLSSVESIVDNVESMMRDKKLQSIISSAAENSSVVLASTFAIPTTSNATTPKKVSITKSSSVQQVYDLVFCLWCMSLDCSSDESVRSHFARDGVVSALAHLLKKAPREKVLRLTLACLRSLAELEESPSFTTEVHFVQEMVGSGVLKSLETVRGRRWNDEDLEENLKYLHALLTERTEDYTQFNVYKAKIEAVNLQWDDMLHTPEFFRMNARLMEKENFCLFKRLIDFLYSNTKSGRLRTSGRGHQISYIGLNEVGGSSWDEDDVKDDEVSESLAVCLYDVGEFVRHYPNGKSVAKKFGAKTLVMQYVNHPREEVQEQALLCASKLLVNNWMAIGN